MTWEEYCKKKKIDSAKFQSGDPERWKEWKSLFEQMHPNSFTEQKKFLINNIRRLYLLKEEKVVQTEKTNEGPKEPESEKSSSKPTGPVIPKKPGGVKIPPRKPGTEE